MACILNFFLVFANIVIDLHEASAVNESRGLFGLDAQ